MAFLIRNYTQMSKSSKYPLVSFAYSSVNLDTMKNASKISVSSAKSIKFRVSNFTYEILSSKIKNALFFQKSELQNFAEGSHKKGKTRNND